MPTNRTLGPTIFESNHKETIKNLAGISEHLEKLNRILENSERTQKRNTYISVLILACSVASSVYLYSDQILALFVTSSDITEHIVEPGGFQIPTKM